MTDSWREGITACKRYTPPMAILRKISDWLKYERLNYYPALAAFEQPEGLRRLQAYEREERKACQPWLTTVWVLILVFMSLWIVLEYFNSAASVLMVVLQIPGWVLQYVLYRRIRRRVNAKVAAELLDGRLWTCFECGYDLRASAERCPECGADVHVRPPMASK